MYFTINFGNGTSTSNTTSGFWSDRTIFVQPAPPPRLPHPADAVPENLARRILSVSVLEARAGTDGEKDAATRALLRLWDRAGIRAKDRAVILAELKRRAGLQ